MIDLTRTIHFAMAQRCWNPRWSEGENWQIYGVAANPHGHDYTCELTLRGAAKAATGIVVIMAKLKAALQQAVADLDGQFLEWGHPAVGERVPTPETLVRLLWRRLTDERLAETFGNGRVHKIKLQAHRRLWVTYAGRGKTMQLTRVYEFCAAHRLRSPFLSDEENALVFGECENPYGHGHNYELHVTVAGQVDERTGLLVDVAALDRIVDEEIISRYDHKHLNHDVEEFRALNPSCENVVKVIWERLSPRLTGARLARVGLRETSKNFFEYAGESEA